MVKNIPKMIIPFLYNDKDFHEKPSDDLASFPSPVIA